MPSSICQSTSARSAASSIAPRASNGVTSAVPQPDESFRRHDRAPGCRSGQHIPHREHAALADEPGRGDECALGEHPAVARDVLEVNLLERRVEHELVRARNRPDANARGRNLAAPLLRRGASERHGRARRRVLLR